MSNFRDRFFSRRALAAIEKHPLAVLVGVTAYVLLPFDLLPEALMGPLGAFDDILAAIAGLAIVKAAAKRRAEARPQQTSAQSPEREPTRPAPSPRSEAPRRPDNRPPRRRWRGRRQGGGPRPD